MKIVLEEYLMNKEIKVVFTCALIIWNLRKFVDCRIKWSPMVMWVVLKAGISGILFRTTANVRAL